MKNLFIFIFLVNLIGCKSSKTGFFNNSESNNLLQSKLVISTTPIQYFSSIDRQPKTEVTKTAAPAILMHSSGLQNGKELNKTVQDYSFRNKHTIEPQLQQNKHPLSTKKIERLSKTKNNQRSAVGSLALVVLSIVLPPLAVFFVDGITTPFWIDVLLTILGFIPGVIYALYRVLKNED